MKPRIDPHTLKVLEFDKIITLLVKFSTSELGKRYCHNITPQTDSSLIRERLSEVTEMKSLIGVQGLFPFNGLRDITLLIEKAEPEGAALNPLELRDILPLLESSRLVKSFLKKDKEKYPAVEALTNKIKILTTIEKELSAAVDSEGEILDSASRELERIRIKIKKVRRQTRTVLEDIINHQDYGSCIQEKFITIRHDRYVIPIKAAFKTRIPGVVHDQSSNRATFFIEPLKVVELNNELTLLKNEEKEEKIRILRQLTTLVRKNKETLMENQKFIGILDSIQARARISEKMGAREPELVNQREIRLFQARHPILMYPASASDDFDFLTKFDNSKVVPIDLLFPSGFSALIISGANMGGKTAALKTIGLLTLMVQAGMHISVAEGSCLTIWETIFADIGDEQNLEESISTFSSHINQLNKILNQANEKSLVLLDEVGAGTDPHEGAALGLAIMGGLRSRRTKVAVTSHLNLLKAYAASHDDAMNVSVGFDSVNLKPTFKLLYGVPGNSKALETATRLGIDSQILIKAKTYLKDYDRRIIELIEDLASTVQRIISVKRDFEKIVLSASRYEKVVVKLVKKIESKKETIFSQIERKARTLFREAESEIKKILKSGSSLDKSSIKEIQREMISIKGPLIDNLTNPKRPIKELGVLKKGDRVVLGKGGKEGEIVDIDYLSNKVEIQVGGLRLKAGIDDLARIEIGRIDSHQKPMVENSGIISPTLEFSESPSPLNIIGLTVDEAIPLVDKAIDNALLYKKKDLRIIHGLGTGRLRQAIHDYLKQQPRIKIFYPGDPLEGGAGITIIELES